MCAICRNAVNQFAFSILDLLVALAIAGIVIATAIPAVATWRAGARMHEAVRQITLDLKRIRSLAIVEGTEHGLVFKDGAHSYSHEAQSRGTFGIIGGEVRLPPGISISECTAPNHRVSFRPRGNALGFGAITLAGQRVRPHRIVINIAGRMRIE